MDSFKSTLARQKFGKLTSATPPPSIPLKPNTGTQPLHNPSPPHAAPAPQFQAPRASTSLQPIQNAPVMYPARATSTVQPVYPSPPLSAPGQEMQTASQQLAPAPSMARSIFDLLDERQIQFSNNTIKTLNYKAEMFTREEAEKLQPGSVFVHSDGVIRFHQEARGEVRQTPLYIMDA